MRRLEQIPEGPYFYFFGNSKFFCCEFVPDSADLLNRFNSIQFYLYNPIFSVSQMLSGVTAQAG